jgi:hypothetical protein
MPSYSCADGLPGAAPIELSRRAAPSPPGRVVGSVSLYVEQVVIGPRPMVFSDRVTAGDYRRR